MRKTLLTVVAVVLMTILVPSEALAQLRLGVKGGYNMTKLSLNTDDFKANRNGFFIGPSLVFNLPVFGLGFDVAALYDERDARVGDDPVADLNQKSIMVPVNLRFALAPDSPFYLFFFAGPQFGLNIGAKEKMLDAARRWKFKESSFSVNVGGGLALFKKVHLSVNYNIAMGRTADVNSVQDVVDDLKEREAKMHAWQLALAIYL